MYGFNSVAMNVRIRRRQISSAIGVADFHDNHVRHPIVAGQERDGHGSMRELCFAVRQIQDRVAVAAVRVLARRSHEDRALFVECVRPKGELLANLD
jgi:hypothetical protein